MAVSSLVRAFLLPSRPFISYNRFLFHSSSVFSPAFRHTPITSHAFRSFDTVSVADEVPSVRRKSSLSTSWEDAGQAFFSSREGHAEDDSSEPQRNSRQWQHSEPASEQTRHGYREQTKGPGGRPDRERRGSHGGKGSVSWGGVKRATPRFRAGGLNRQLRPDLDEIEEEQSPSSYSRGMPRWEDEQNSMSKKRDWRDSRKEPSSINTSSLPKVKGEVIYGVAPVYAALQISRREFFCLYVQENMPIDGGKRKDKTALQWVLRSAIDRGLAVKEVSKHDLNLLVDNRPHQGLVLDASPLELVLVSELEEPVEENGKAPVWVALDEVTDPQNFGAILRSAYFLGASGVVVCAKNSAPLSGVVSKASAGALEVMEIRSCRNMVKFLDKSTENGWRVVGAAASGRDVEPVRELEPRVPTVLILGGEGRGLRTNVRRACDHLVCVPGIASKRKLEFGPVEVCDDGSDGEVENEDQGREDAVNLKEEDFVAVESLNVSVAAGILLHELINGQVVTESSAPSEVASSDS